MSWLLTLAAWPFAAAGAAAAGATLLIHLLNRRRPRPIEWSAMEFLREAVQKNQRTIRWRDAALLTLRCVAVLLFGLALARPQFAGQGQAAALQPVHMIVVIDNSLSMAFETLDGTLLGRAKEAAAHLLDHVPPGSLISVIPSADPARSSAAVLHPDRDSAAAAIGQIGITDQATDLESTTTRIGEAAGLSADLPTRVVFFTDLQRSTWHDVPQSKRLDNESLWQIIDISPAGRDNTSIAGVAVSGGFAISGMQTAIVATVRRSGGRTARNVEVRLVVDDIVIGSRALELPPGDSQQQVHFTHTFSPPSRPAGLGKTIVSVSLTPDRLPQDDSRHAVVPVFSGWPLVFVDELGEQEEEEAAGKLGETWPVRRLLAPRTADPAIAKPIHVTPDQLSEEHLAAARAVVVAGVRDPRLIASRLQAFVEGGGQLLIAAGGDFDPAAWNANAWLGGRGLLPVPLGDRFVGNTPDETTEDLQVWLLDAAGVIDTELFRLAGNLPGELRELYSEPLFFKQVRVEEQSMIDGSVHILAYLLPAGDGDEDADSEHRLPLLLQRRTGGGQTLLLTTGLRPRWNNLAKTNAVVILDRVLRHLVRDTLPILEFETSPRIELPVPDVVRRSTIMLLRPGQTAAAAVEVDDRTVEGAGIVVANALQRGIYRLAVVADQAGAAWNFPIAVNGPARESDLTKAADAAIARFAVNRNVTRTSFGDGVGMHEMFQPRQGIAWWLAAAVLGLLLVESSVLAASALASRSRSPKAGWTQERRFQGRSRSRYSSKQA